MTKQSKFNKSVVTLCVIAVIATVVGVVLSKLYYIDPISVWALDSSGLSGLGESGFTWKEHLFLTVPNYLWTISALLLIVAIGLQLKGSFHKKN